LGLKVLNMGHLEELSKFREKWMRFFGFRLPFRPSLLRLCKTHSRGESEGIFEWALLMAEVRKFFLGRPPKKTCKTG
jgi:hypothetical protein